MGVNEEGSTRGADGEGKGIVAGERHPLEGRDLAIFRGERWADPDGVIGRRIKGKDDSQIGTGKGEGAGVESGKQGRIREPALLLSGANVGEVLASDEAHLPEMMMSSPGHSLWLVNSPSGNAGFILTFFHFN